MAVYSAEKGIFFYEITKNDTLYKQVKKTSVMQNSNKNSRIRKFCSRNFYRQDFAVSL